MNKVACIHVGQNRLIFRGGIRVKDKPVIGHSTTPGHAEQLVEILTLP